MASSRLACEVDLAGVLDVQFVQLRADLAPDARFFRRVVDERRAESFQAVLAAQGEQLLAAADVALVAQAGVARLQFQFGRVRRRHHRLGVDGRSVFDERGGFFHDACPSCGTDADGPPRRGRIRINYTPARPAAEPPTAEQQRTGTLGGTQRTMKAAYIETTGSPDVIRYGDLPTPTPQAGEVLVRVGAAALNPIDTVHPGRHGRHAAAEAVHPRLRPGRHGRGGRAGREALQGRRPRLGLQPGAARPAGHVRGVRRRCTRTGSTRRRPA